MTVVAAVMVGLMQLDQQYLGDAVLLSMISAYWYCACSGIFRSQLLCPINGKGARKNPIQGIIRALFRMGGVPSSECHAVLPDIVTMSNPQPPKLDHILLENQPFFGVTSSFMDKFKQSLLAIQPAKAMAGVGCWAP